MSQREFHRIYEQMPEGFKAELIDGTVFVREPLGGLHGSSHMRFSTLLDVFSAATPGVAGYLDATVILSKTD